MAILTKTVADLVTAWETGTLIRIELAAKKPGADRFVLLVLRHADPVPLAEVWDVG